MNPANPNSLHWQQTHNNVVKSSPLTQGDWLLTGIIVGFFALVIAANLLKQWIG